MDDQQNHIIYIFLFLLNTKIHAPDCDIVAQDLEDEDGEVGLVHEGEHGQPEHEPQRYRHRRLGRPMVDERIPARVLRFNTG